MLAGLVVLPPGVDLWDYIFDGTTEAPAINAVAGSRGIDDFQQEYVASLGSPKISEGFAKTQSINLSHFARFRRKNAGLPEAMKDWTSGHIKQDRLWRLGPKGKGKSGRAVRAVTVKKEVGAIRRMFERARRLGLIELNPVRDLEPIPDDARTPRSAPTRKLSPWNRPGIWRRRSPSNYVAGGC